MKMVKSLILGSAAGIVAMSGAQAADLPVKAKAVEYVRICSLYGAGFYYIPGTDTCIKLGGYLRVDVLANSNSDDTGNTGTPGSAKNRFTNAYTWRSREDLSIDTRTATEYGVVRTFADLTFTWTDDNVAGNGTSGAGTVYGPIGGGTGVAPGAAPNNAAAGTVAYGTVGVYYAFIQFAGFTMGKAISQFSAPWTAYPGNNFDGLVGGGGTVTGVNQFTYTAEFGGGVSATISAQDPTQYYQAGVLNFSPTGTSLAAFFGGPTGSNDYGGTQYPDIVATVKVDQAWGLFQLSAAAHDNHTAYYNNNATSTAIGGGLVVLPNEVGGGPADKWGFAVQAALQIKNIPTGPGDTINVQGVYTDGATRYNIQDLAGQAGAATMFGSSNAFPGARSIGFGIAPDTVFTADSLLFGTNQQQLIQTWGARGAFNHNFDPYWSASVYGAYASIHYNATGAAIFCAGFQAAFGTDNVCNPNYNIAQAGVIVRWTPVKNLTFSADATFEHLDQKMLGFVNFPGSSAFGKPSVAVVGPYELKDQNNLQVLLRAQRNW